MTLVADQSGVGEHILTVTGAAVTSHLKVSFAGGVPAVTAGAPGHLDVRLAVEGSSVTWQTFDAGTIAIAAGQTLTLRPGSWDLLDSAPVAAQVTIGRRHRPLRLRNHFQAPAAEITASKLTKDGRSLSVTLMLPALEASSSRVTVTAAIRHSGRIIAQASSAVALGARRRTLTLIFPKPVPLSSTAQLAALTYTFGASPSTAATTKTVKLG